MATPSKCRASTRRVRCSTTSTGFHDGFMKRIAIVSHDDIDEEYAQSCTGRFDVEIDFAHYNYRLLVEPAMALGLERSFLLEQHRRWENRRMQFFTFSTATFHELL